MWVSGAKDNETVDKDSETVSRFTETGRTKIMRLLYIIKLCQSYRDCCTSHSANFAARRRSRFSQLLTSSTETPSSAAIWRGLGSHPSRINGLFKPVSGPKVDMYHRNLFRREDIEQMLSEHLPNADKSNSPVIGKLAVKITGAVNVSLP
jgi:hypothetical protein